MRIIRLPQNQGPGPARETGLRAVGTDLVGFVDNDVAPMPDCFQLLAAALRDAGGATLAMPRVVHAEEPERIQFEGARAHFIGLMALESAEQPVHEPAAAPHAISSIVTACFLVDRHRWGVRSCRTRASSCTTRTTIWVCARASSVTGSSPCRVRCAGTARARPALSARRAGGYPPRRVVLMIANRWRILLTRYELRTLILLAPALLIFELCQLAGAIAKGWTASWAEAAADDRQGFAADRQRAPRLGEPNAVSVTATFWRGAPCPSTRASSPAAWSGGLRASSRVP